MVQPNPKLSVAAAMAGTRDKGSLTGHWAPDFTACESVLP
jgi:hypothetical protein